MYVLIVIIYYVFFGAQDGLRLTIQFSSQEGEYELDADTQEDKNSVCVYKCTWYNALE